MKTTTVFLYFLLVVVGLSSIGVILPLIFDAYKNDPNIYKNFNQNITTYFIAILMTSSLDILMKFLDDDKPYRKPAVLGICIINLLILIMCGFLIYDNYNGEYNAVPLKCILGVILAYIAWWFANYNNSNFNITSTLGGNPNNTLSNGK